MLTRFDDEKIVHRGAHSLVRRARRRADHLPVLLKSANSQEPSPEQRARIRHEFELLTRLNLEGIPRVLELAEDGYELSLVLEDVGARPLHEEFVPAGMELGRFFDLALELCRLVGEIHRVHVIHKHITPANVVVHPRTGQPLLIDFALASRLPREHATVRAAERIEGTLAYVSPEQTGRMNRALDWRTDLYSLGATFYEMLTNQPPLSAAEPMTMVHAILARVPVAPHVLRPGLPAQLSAIVLKLLSKNAEERYQSAAAVAHDLAEARRQFTETGTIQPFEVATHQAAYRFHIPQQLYGRDAELRVLMDAFERVAGGSTELVVVSGPSGVGKSVLVNELYKPITTRRGYLVSGKYDRFQRDIPYSAIVRAFRDLLHQWLTEREEHIQRIRRALLEALGANAGLLTRSIPGLELLLGPQPEVPELPSDENRNRYNLAFLLFVQVLATEEHPLAIFLDDLQWADQASLELLQRLASGHQTRHLLLLIAYREDEVNTAHPLAKLLETLASEQRPLREVLLRSLELTQVRRLVADALRQSEEAIAPLADLIFDRTQGNAFFVREFLLALHEQGLLRHSTQSGRWDWEPETIRGLQVTDNVAEWMTGRLQRLPEETQRVLQLAACVGSRFDVRLLAVISEQTTSRTIRTLFPAIEAGLLSPVTVSGRLMRGAPEDEVSPEEEEGESSACRFAHDRVQQAAYELVPESQRNAVHLKIGRLLLSKLNEEARQTRLFEIVQHIDRDLTLIEEPAEREQLARLNLSAALRAKDSAAFQPMAAWLRAGRTLLPQNAWETQYELALALYSEGAEAARLTDAPAEMELLFSEVLRHSRTVLDKIPVYETRLSHLTGQNRNFEALELARELLSVLGVDLPARPSKPRVMMGLMNTMRAMRGRTVADLAALRPMTDPVKLAAMRILIRTMSCAYSASPNTFPFILFNLVQLSVRHGTGTYSAAGFCAYAMLLSAVLGKHEEGYELGRFALSLGKRFSRAGLGARGLVTFNGIMAYWKHHVRETLEPLLKAHQLAAEVGDLEFVGVSRFMYSHHLLHVGAPLESVQRPLEELIAAASSNKSDFVLSRARLLHQFVLTLQGKGAAALLLKGTSFDEERDLPRLTEAKNLTALFVAYQCKAVLGLLHGDPRAAMKHAARARTMNSAVLGALNLIENTFIEALAMLACHGELNARQRFTLRGHRRYLHRCARQSPVNFRAKHLLVEAEWARVHRRTQAALASYEQAISSALASGYIQDAAMAMELAGRHHLTLGLQRSGWLHLHEAWRTFRRWGAHVKAAALEAELMAAPAGLLPAQQQSLPPAHRDGQSSLDLTTVLSASRAISEKLVLSALLPTLVRLLLENAGAERVVLLLDHDGKLLIEAECHVGAGDTSPRVPLPVEEQDRLSTAILNYVVRTGENVVLHHAAAEGLFTTDEHVARHQLKSVLCAPLMNQGRLIAVVYMENNLTTGAFTTDRLEVLRVLMSQAVLSLHNAHLYERLEFTNKRLEEHNRTLEEKVDARTRELRTKNVELGNALTQVRETQAQLVHKEKLASLGALTAGVAHELKNPLNFVNNFARLSKPLVEELTELLDTAGGATRAEWRGTAEELLALLRDNLGKIEEHGNRADGIISGMLQHAKGPSSMELTDLNELVAKTVKLAYHGTRLKDAALHVALEFDFDESIGKLDVAPPDLGRVIINLVDNALYALEERRLGAEPGYAPRLQVRTRGHGDRCEVRVIDNGPGIPKECLERIYHPFFTTKPPGHGVGLGLSISQDLVRAHGGELRVSTSPGLTEFVLSLPKRQDDAGERR